MKTNFWSKTLLYVYKYLERVAGGIDKLVNENALNSFYYMKGSRQDNGVMAVAERIIELSERKIKLINLKVLIEKALKSCDKLYAQILVERYIDNLTSEEIASRHNLAMRTYFRRLATAEEKFNNQLLLQGYNDKRLNEYTSSEMWIQEVYDTFENCRKDEEEILEEICGF